MNPTEILYYAVAALVAIISIARLTRLFTQDVYPPIAWLRSKWQGSIERNPHVDDEWAVLAICPYCAAPWVTVAIGLWAHLSEFHWTWWWFNGWLAVAYLAAMLVVRDGE